MRVGVGVGVVLSHPASISRQPSAVAAEVTKPGHPLFSFPTSEAPWLCKCLILTQNHEGCWQADTEEPLL